MLASFTEKGSLILKGATCTRWNFKIFRLVVNIFYLNRLHYLSKRCFSNHLFSRFP